MSVDTDTTLRSVASILALTVLLDRRQRDLEMIEYCNAVMRINRELRPDVILPRRTILDWYDAHKVEFQTALADDPDDSYKRQMLETLQDNGIRKTVLAAIFAISICDYEFRDEEADFIKMALEIWKTGLPKADAMTAIAG